MLNPNAFDQMDALEFAVQEDVAWQAAYQLDENIKRGARSGEKYPGLPERSSSRNEYPQEQYGILRRSVGVEPQGKDHLIGFIDAPVQAFILERLLPDGSDKTTTKGVRFPLTRTMSEAKTHKRMLEAADDGS